MAGQVGGAKWVIETSPGAVGGAKWVIPTSPGAVGGAKWVISTSPGAVGGAEWVIPTSPGAVGGAEWVIYTGCFPLDERVHMDSDVRTPIGALKVGDKISSWNIEQKKTQLTSVTEIHTHNVYEIICFNNAMRVSFSHPIMVVEDIDAGLLIPKWKVALDVNVGDYVVGSGGELTAIKSKSRHWYDKGIKVLSLSTDCGQPFMVGGCVVRADNAIDSIAWADTPVTRELLAS